MSTSSARPAAFKPLTLPRSLSRVLSRLLAMPPEDSLPLARDAHASATCPRQRIIAMRLRLRLLQEALQALQSPVEETPEPEPVIEIVAEPEPEPVEEPKAPAPKMGKLISMDLEGGALAMMMQGLGGSQGDDDDDDDFFSKD